VKRQKALWIHETIKFGVSYMRYKIMFV
jgi:hypothetical protein